MKKFLLAALVALPALGVVSHSAEAGGWCRGPNCGESRNGTPYPPGGSYEDWDWYRVKYRKTFISDHPWPGYGTDIYIRPGTVLRAKCFSNTSGRWCKIKSGRYASMFVPEWCLWRHYPDYYSDDYSYRYGPSYYYKNYYYNDNGYNGYNGYNSYNRYNNGDNDYNGYYNDYNGGNDYDNGYNSNGY